MTAHKTQSLTVAALFAFRMLGLFMIYPVFSVYAKHLQGATPLLTGVAIGIYGLFQACLQAPFGMLSDKYGRKAIITLGLSLFILGSLIAANASTIYGVIVGRSLQGAGAIGSTLMALLADLTPEEKRAQAMAMVGMCIGVSFAIALVTGPLLVERVHISGLFYLSALLGTLGIVLLISKVPTPQQVANNSECCSALLPKVLRDINLWRLNFSIFCQHAILTAIFIVTPILLTQHHHMPVQKQWLVYLGILLLSFLVMVPLIILTEKRQKHKTALQSAVTLLGLSQWALWLSHHHFIAMLLSLLTFFIAFNLLEALLPSMVSRVVDPRAKGTALGVYSTCQFLGIFVGGLAGGWLYGHHHIASVFYLSALLTILWLTIAKGLLTKKLETRLVHN